MKDIPADLVAKARTLIASSHPAFESDAHYQGYLLGLAAVLHEIEQAAEQRGEG